MRILANRERIPHKPVTDDGFTLVEVLIAGAIMIILCVGILTVFSYAVKINSGNNLRIQAQSVLQQEVEYYRSIKFIPGAGTTADLPNHRPPELYGSAAGITYTRPQRTSADGQVFNITTIVKNVSFSAGGTDEAHCIFKEIAITAAPAVAKNGWLSDLKTTLTVQRVRAN